MLLLVLASFPCVCIPLLWIWLPQGSCPVSHITTASTHSLIRSSQNIEPSTPSPFFLGLNSKNWKQPTLPPWFEAIPRAFCSLPPFCRNLPAFHDTVANYTSLQRSLPSANQTPPIFAIKTELIPHPHSLGSANAFELPQSVSVSVPALPHLHLRSN